MNPYERIVASSSQKKHASRSKPQAPQPSAVLSRVKSRKIPKPRTRLSVEYRYQFDLPEPPMDLMMLRGTMAPDAFANPLSIPIERLARPKALPADPRFGLCGNLLDTSIYNKPVGLTDDDEALLLSIEAESKTPITMVGSSSSTGKNGLAPPRRQAIAPVPWMRRMSYDEYNGGTHRTPRPLARVNTSGLNALTKLSRPQLRKTPTSLRPKPTIQRSFLLAGKMPVHPNKRRSHMLKPVRVTPLFPDFSSMSENFISLQFENNMNLSHPHREKDPEQYKKAAMHMATIALTGEQNETFLASYTPSDDSLRRLTGDKDGDVDMANGTDNTHVYEHVCEYRILDPSKYNLSGHNKRAIRPIYAIQKYESADGKKRVATLARVSVSWKLKQRPLNLPQLGKPHLKVRKVPLPNSNQEKKFEDALNTFYKK